MQSCQLLHCLRPTIRECFRSKHNFRPRRAPGEGRSKNRVVRRPWFVEVEIQHHHPRTGVGKAFHERCVTLPPSGIDLLRRGHDRDGIHVERSPERIAKPYRRCGHKPGEWQPIEQVDCEAEDNQKRHRRPGNQAPVSKSESPPRTVEFVPCWASCSRICGSAGHLTRNPHDPVQAAFVLPYQRGVSIGTVSERLSRMRLPVTTRNRMPSSYRMKSAGTPKHAGRQRRCRVRSSRTKWHSPHCRSQTAEEGAIERLRKAERLVVANRKLHCYDSRYAGRNYARRHTHKGGR